MALTPEAVVKRDVVKLLDSFNIWHFFPAANGFGRAGIPDIIGCGGGWFIAIECKAGSNTTTALQERELASIRKCGGFAFVANERNLQELKGRLECLLS
jgi:Holliday junction resolvase